MILIKSFDFDSAHFIPNHPKCGNTHGHCWQLKVSLEGEPNETGMLIDFHLVKDIVDENIIKKLDHKFLNEVLDFAPTCENLTKWIWKQLEDKWPKNIKLQRIKLAETKGNYIAYYGK